MKKKSIKELSLEKQRALLRARAEAVRLQQEELEGRVRTKYAQLVDEWNQLTNLVEEGAARMGLPAPVAQSARELERKAYNLGQADADKRHKANLEHQLKEAVQETRQRILGNSMADLANVWDEVQKQAVSAATYASIVSGMYKNRAKQLGATDEKKVQGQDQ